MRKFSDYLKMKMEAAKIDMDSAEKIVFDSLGIDDDSDARTVARSTPLSMYDDRDKLLDQGAIRNHPSYEEIETAVKTRASKTTVGDLIDMLVEGLGDKESPTISPDEPGPVPVDNFPS
jgi:hypothetical protein